MKQLNLAMLPQIVYRPESFLLHAGVRAVFEESEVLLARSRYCAVFISGGARSGKTHFLLKMVAAFEKKGFILRFLNGEEVHSFLATEAPNTQFGPADLVVMDDVDKYFHLIKPGDSGPFVTFIERMRLADAHLLVASAARPDSFQCDAHIISRISEATHLSIQDPDEASLAPLVKVMAAQRGIRLSPRKLEFLQRRIRRSTASIEELLEKVVHLSSVLGEKISLSVLEQSI